MGYKFSVIDLFCGAGGLSEGFRLADFKILLGIDSDKISLETYQKNFSESKAYCADLFDFNPEKIKNELGKKKPDVIIGGPPCQGFSLTGTRNVNDPRNKLYISFYKTVKVLKPKAFLIENVPGLANLYEGKIKDNIIESFDDLGYNVTCKVLCAADFKVPQIRKRLFFVGIKKKYGVFKFPEKIIKNPKKYISCEEAINDLPALDGVYAGRENSQYNEKAKSKYQKEMRNGDKILYNHVATKHTEYVKNVISLVPEGGNYKDLPKGVGESRKFNEAWTRYHSKKPSKTIDTGHRNHFHYKYKRVPTVRENARLQSFKDSFVFLGTKTSQYRQVGNAVPPKLAYYVAKKIKEQLDDQNAN